jgi:hypothetical protein
MKKYIVLEPITNEAETITLVPSPDNEISHQDLIADGFTEAQITTFLATGRLFEKPETWFPPLPPPTP